MREVVTILAALVGAIVGSLGAVWLTARERRADEQKARRRALVGRHLFQLQDAVETLWHRLHNLRERGGRYVMTDEYFAQTTLYALGRVLATERILGLEGVYPEIATLDSDLAEFLKGNRVDPELSGAGFYQYDRLTLAELLIEREGDRFRVKTYVEFRREYEASGSGDKEWLAPGRDHIAGLTDNQIDQLMSCLRSIANRLARETELPTSVGQPS